MGFFLYPKFFFVVCLFFCFFLFWDYLGTYPDVFFGFEFLAPLYHKGT